MKALRTLLIASLLLVTGGGAIAFAASEDARQVGQELVQQTTIRVRSGCVEIENNGGAEIQVVVYGITGSVVKSQSVQPGVTVIDLSAGCYIVKAGNITRKVAVR